MKRTEERSGIVVEKENVKVEKCEPRQTQLRKE